MTNANASGADLHEKCSIHHNIQQKDLLSLLNIIVESLRFGDAVADPETQVPKIYPDWLSLEFVRERSEDGITPNGFYVHPGEKNRSEAKRLQKNILTLKDVTDIFKSLPEYIDKKIEDSEYSNVDVLNEVQNQLLNRLKADQSGELIKADLNFLREDSVNLLSIVATLGENVKTGEKAPETSITLPDQYKSLISGELNLPVSWEWVKPLVNDVEKATLNTRVIFFDFDGKPLGVDVKQIRFFLNTWLKKLYEEYEQKFREKGTPLPESRLFDATNKLALYFDLDVWVELDVEVSKFIAGELAKVIDEYLKSKSSSGGLPFFEKKSTEEDENKKKVTANANKVEDVDDLIKKFEDAGKSYRDETNRLTTILLPQFFAMHGIRLEIADLASIDMANFTLIEREFHSELENVLRSLTPAELQLLSTRGASLEFRLLVLRKSYGKLSTNPRFIGLLTQFTNNYVSQIDERINQGKPRQNDIEELREFNKQRNLPNAAFNLNLEKKERATREDWIKDSSGAGKGVSELTAFSKLHDITQADLQLLVSRLANGGSVDYQILFRNLDVIIAERWSPEQLRNLSGNNVPAVLGMILPDSIQEDPKSLNLFLQISAEYLYARRQHLADHYQLDQISRDSGKVADLTSLAAAQNQAERYKDYGGAEAVIVARASDSTRVKSYQSNIAAGVNALHEETTKQRKQDINTRHQIKNEAYRNEKTIAGKRKFLASLGVLSPDIDSVNNEEAAQFQLLQSLYEEAMGHDYRDQVEALDTMSYYESEDGGYVQDDDQDVDQAGEAGQPSQRRAAPARYGKPGARSLMKGALKLRQKFKTAKKRIERAKKVLKIADKALDKVEAAVLAPVLGPLANNKFTRRGAIAILAGMVLDTVNLMTNSFGGAVGGLTGAFIGGGITGALGYSSAGPVGLLMTTPGAIVGAWTGARTGASFFGGSAPAISVNGPGFSLGAGAAAKPAFVDGGSKTALSGQAAASGGLSGKAGSALATGGATLGTITIGTATLLAGLQAPPIQTLDSSGLESRYVSIRKTTSDDTTSFPGAVPGQITYQIYMQAKDNYQIDLQDFQDEFTIKVNTEKSSETPAGLDCTSQLNIDTAVTKSFTGADGEVLLGECTVPLSETYHDSSILNEITIQFRVSENGVEIPNDSPNLSCGESDSTFCALTTLSVCLGECPATRQGCWPTTGTLTQPPYGSYSHSSLDAFDIAAPRGTPVYATYEGVAYAFDANDPESTNQGLIWRKSDGSISRIYGKHVLLVTNEGFVLLYGHLNEHGEKMVLGTGVPVKPGDLVGGVGNSGSTIAFPMGNHLHYEYRIPSGGTWGSVAPGSPRDPLSLIVPDEYSLNKPVTTCYP